MRTSTSQLKFTLLMFVAMLIINLAQAQLRQSHVVNPEIASARRTTSYAVKVNVNTLNDLMVKCVGLGIENVKLVFATIRSEDLVPYTKNHPDARGFEKELLGKQTVLVMIEGEDISQNNFFSLNGTHNDPLFNTMINAGFTKLDKPYSDVPARRMAVYFELGSICPPPNSCF